MDPCNALTKKGSRTLICELPFGHSRRGSPEHAMGEERWTDSGGWVTR